MSMLSEQIAKLRKTAESIDWEIPEAAELLREAADTIEDLRDRLQNQAFALGMQEALGNGTCEQVLTDCDDGLMPPFTAHCGACGAEWGFTPKYCYNCGAKVTGTRDERKVVER